LKNEKNEIRSLICDQCGKQFETSKTIQRFCSVYCRQKWAYANPSIRGVERKCSYCGKVFYSSGSEVCSRRCYAMQRYFKRKELIKNLTERCEELENKLNMLYNRPSG
jgi:5-methylcytosine-specific restriction endonuclease McrA